jgi:hypothetical protein
MFEAKRRFKRYFRLSKSGNTFIQKRMSFIGALSLRIPVSRSTLIGFVLPLASLVGIAGKRKKLLTCTQETTSTKLKRLRSSRLILRDQTITTIYAMTLSKAKRLIRLLAPIKYY